MEIDYTAGDFLILATDGLWDYIKPKEIAEYLLNLKHYVNGDDTQETNFGILNLMLKKVSHERKIPLQDLLDMRPGPQKRRIHDDVTIILVEF
jgi:serine/threonine protein phosphatase PrpC